MRALIRIMFHIILILVLSITTLPSNAAGEGKVVKVGYFTVGPYYKVDAQGQVQSYDTDYLKEISRRSGLKFEFVDCGTWIHGADMLDSGELDLLGLSLWNQEREDKYEFCLNSYGYNVSEIVMLPDKTVKFQDFEAIGKMKIGCRFNYVPKENMIRRLAEQGQHPQVVLFKTQQELVEALKNGSVDAIATSTHLVEQDLHIIDKFEYVPFYFMAKKGNTELTDKVDAALAEIQVTMPQFDDDLLAKYFPSINLYPLSFEEQKFIDSLGTLNFAFCANSGYLCRVEDGHYVGIQPAIAKKLCQMLGITYKEVIIDYPQLVKKLAAIPNSPDKGELLKKEIADMGIDVWGDVYFDTQWSDVLSVGMTNPYLDTTYYEIRTKGDTVDRDNEVLALPLGIRSSRELAKMYKSQQVVLLNDVESCIDAVKNGSADFTIVNSYAAEYYLSMFKYNELTSRLIPFSHKTSMAVVDSNKKMLVTALNKKLHSLPKDEFHALVQQETMKQPDQNVLTAIFYTHTKTVFVAMALVVGALILLLAMWYIIRKSRQQNEILQQATNAKSEFLAKMSHDMRTPMNAIVNLTNMVEEEIDNKSLALEDLRKIKNSNEFLLSLISDILDVSKIEQGKMELHHNVYRVPDFINYIHATFDALCKKHNLTFEVVVPQQDVAMLVDRVRFNQVCFNLISNSVKYTKAGGKITLKVDYQLREDGSLPTDIYVIDNGIGMSKEFQQQAFEQFKQENRLYMSMEGAGLGLSIVKEIVKLMQGTIKIDSKIDQGTSIHIQLPLQSAQGEVLQSNPKETETVDKVSEDFSALQGKHVLVVEDHLINMQIAVRLLEKKGMVVTTAADGAKGVEIFKTQGDNLDLILMDIRMPVMNGLEAAKAIRSLETPKAKSVVILAMTANAYQEDMDKSMEAGMNGHLAKPINPKVLYGTIAKFLK